MYAPGHSFSVFSGIPHQHFSPHTPSPPHQALGCIALAVTAWPHAGLTAKTAALSPSAVEQLGLLGLFPTGGPRGAVLHVHAVPHSCAAATSLELTPVEVALQEDGGDDGLTQQQQQPDRNDYDRDDDRDDDNALVLVLVQPPPPGSAAAGSAGPFSHGNRNTALLRMSRYDGCQLRTSIHTLQQQRHCYIHSSFHTAVATRHPLLPPHLLE